MNVNKDIFEDTREQIRAQTKVWWSLFSDEDLANLLVTEFHHAGPVTYQKL